MRASGLFYEEKAGAFLWSYGAAARDTTPGFCPDGARPWCMLYTTVSLGSLAWLGTGRGDDRMRTRVAAAAPGIGRRTEAINRIRAAAQQAATAGGIDTWRTGGSAIGCCTNRLEYPRAAAQPASPGCPSGIWSRPRCMEQGRGRLGVCRGSQTPGWIQQRAILPRWSQHKLWKGPGGPGIRLLGWASRRSLGAAPWASQAAPRSAYRRRREPLYPAQKGGAAATRRLPQRLPRAETLSCSHRDRNPGQRLRAADPPSPKRFAPAFSS